MRYRRITICLFASLLLIGYATFTYKGMAQKASDVWKPTIPKVWVDAEIAELEVPLAEAALSPKHISADYYYRIPVAPVYKSYPIYAPGKEPSGYLDWLKQQEPEIVFDAAKLKTEADWIKAGEFAFERPQTYFPVTPEIYARDPAYYERIGLRITKEGINPYQRYYIREKGKVEIGRRSCAECHTRLLPDGTLLKGAQGNFPFERHQIFPSEKDRERIEAFLAAGRNIPRPPLDDPVPSSFEELIGRGRAIPPGVIARHRTRTLFPVQVPDLIGIKERRYLDRTGLQNHRSIVDLMRYAALNQLGDHLASFGGYIQFARDGRTLPDPATQKRYSDEQLYALALWLYSLKPPPNPNRFDALAKRGQKVFEQQGCAGCHTPPFYTNNKLTPADGFTVPEEHKKKYDILPLSVGTDPNLTMKTLRGTGYYKVPSLKGVWYRGPFEHSGSVATLEDWFDPKRLRDDYVPTGFIGYGIKTRAVKGHEFGLQLSAEDKRALIAFLKTL